jgi:hypothetical protein
MKFLITLLLMTAPAIQNAFALDPIIRSFQGARASGMGNVRYTTGLYEENFYANPARVTANPANLLQLPKITIEVGNGALGAVQDLTKGEGGLQPFSDSIGKPLSARVQMVFPAFYARHFLADFWAMGIGMLVSAQSILQLGQNGVLDPTTVITAGPAITLGRRLLKDDRLSIGATIHTEMRATSYDSFSITDFLNGDSVKSKLKGGSGLGADLDLGSTFITPWRVLGAEYQVAFAVNNVLGGKYKNIRKPLKNWPADPIPSPRSFNFGISAVKEDFAFLDSVSLAFESTDIGNNKNGSMYKTLHLGSEAKWKFLAVRAGLNQGYYTAGFGLDFKLLQINAATYGEELGLNAGVIEDRRYIVDIGFQI